MDALFAQIDLHGGHVSGVFVVGIRYLLVLVRRQVALLRYFGGFPFGFAGARATLIQLLEFDRRVLADGHPDTLSTMSALAKTMEAQGDLDSARAVAERGTELARQTLGDDNATTLNLASRLASIAQESGDSLRAVTLGRERL